MGRSGSPGSRSTVRRGRAHRPAARHPQARAATRHRRVERPAPRLGGRRPSSGAPRPRGPNARCELVRPGSFCTGSSFAGQSSSGPVLPRFGPPAKETDGRRRKAGRASGRVAVFPATTSGDPRWRAAASIRPSSIGDRRRSALGGAPPPRCGSWARRSLPARSRAQAGALAGGAPGPADSRTTAARCLSVAGQGDRQGRGRGGAAIGPGALRARFPRAQNSGERGRRDRPGPGTSVSVVADPAGGPFPPPSAAGPRPPTLDPGPAGRSSLPWRRTDRRGSGRRLDAGRRRVAGPSGPSRT